MEGELQETAGGWKMNRQLSAVDTKVWLKHVLRPVIHVDVGWKRTR